MSLNVCAHCTTRFAIGVPHCPQCGNADFYEEGSMPKTTRHGGASYPVGVVPPFVAEAGPEPLLPESAGTVVEPNNLPAAEVPSTVVVDLPLPDADMEDDGPDDAPAGPYAGMLRADLQLLCAGRGLSSSGNKADLIARLLADDAQDQ